MFTNHFCATSPDLPPFGDHLCEYILAGNGVFVRARRPGLEALIPVAAADIRGLVSLKPFVKLTNGSIGSDIVGSILAWMREAAPQELLAWVGCEGTGYSACSPEQVTSESRCKPVNPFDLQGQNAILDIHSHGNHRPFFSTTDNADEKNGFRLYAVVGGFPTPFVSMRVGIYGHFWNFPAADVMEIIGMNASTEDGLVDDACFIFGTPFGPGPMFKITAGDSNGDICDECGGHHATDACPFCQTEEGW